MHLSTYRRMKYFADTFVSKVEKSPISIYDIGSYNVNGTYKDFFEASHYNYIGVDIENGPNVDICIKSHYNWREIKSDSADVVISGQALEHIENFWLTVLEISRILKNGGLCCIIVPSSGFEHRHPVDCWRFYPDGLKVLADFCGLEIIEIYLDDKGAIYEDKSEQWADCSIIAKKKNFGVKQKLILKIKWLFTFISFKLKI